jgi:hypothetical protein
MVYGEVLVLYSCECPKSGSAGHMHHIRTSEGSRFTEKKRNRSQDTDLVHPKQRPSRLVVSLRFDFAHRSEPVEGSN